MKDISFNIIKNPNLIIIKCIGIWNINTIDKVEKDFLRSKFNNENISIDLNSITQLDSAGATLILLLKKELLSFNNKITIDTKNAKFQKILNIVNSNLKNEKNIKFKHKNIVEKIGIKTYTYYTAIIDFINFLGEFFTKSLLIFNKKNFRIKEMVYFIYTAGLKAVPIISLTSFLVGIVIAYQTIVQLSKFGADIFVVDASSISITRELGPMITAIVVAGRSASSFSAEIGAMKLTQEIDAMKTMGFKPFYFLIIPRVVALLISLPILIFISDILGIFGAMIATKIQIGLSIDIFINRLYEILSLKHYLVGLVKGPFFAIIIALIGSYHGLKVTQNTESIGEETTKSVVNAIFLVIICDAIFSIIFTRLGL